MNLSGLRFSAWGVDRVNVTMSTVWIVDCGFNNAGVQTRSPILFGTETATVRKHGEVAFINGCLIREQRQRTNPMVWANLNVQAQGVKDIIGEIVVDRPPGSTGLLLDLGSNPNNPPPINCTITVTDLP